jgi:hypothetical protein
MLARTSHQTLSLGILMALIFRAWISPVNAQLNEVIHRVFEEILVNRVVRTSGPLGNHQGNHFLTSADVANSKLAPALNSFIANNITSFPIPTMVPNMTFHMSAGSPVAKTNGLGPIFAEPAETLGKGVLNMGMSFSNLNFNKIRGIPTNDLRFAFTHRDLTGDRTLGDFAPESDVFIIDLDTDINVSISALVATFGVTNALDFGVAVPLIVTELQGEAHATIASFTLANLGAAVHRFGGDDANPILETTVPFQERSIGFGDVALRLKYNFLRGLNLNTAALFEMRLPTGKKADFMGTGKTNFKLAFITEQRIGDFSPHANLAFSRRTAGLNNDRLEFKAGFEQRITEGLNLAVDMMGTHDVNNTETITFPGSTIIYDHLDGQIRERAVELSNIPNRANDNMIDASVGFKFAPSNRFVILGNLLVPLNDGGLRASLVPTAGFSMNF